MHYALLAGVILIGVALRTVNIGRDPLWTDEALTLVLAQWPVWDMIAKPTDPTPFFYYALHKWFVPEGAGVVGVRGISLVAGILAMPVMYAIGRLMFRREGALVATGLLAVSAPLIDYSQEARAYSVLVLLVLLSAAGLLWWSREVRTARPEAGWRPYAALALFGVTTALSLYTHFVASFWIGPAMIILVIIGRKASGRAERMAIWTAAAVVLAAIPEALRTVQMAALPGGFDWLWQASPLLVFLVLSDTHLPSVQWMIEAAPFDILKKSIEALAPTMAYGWVFWRLYSSRQRIRNWSVEHPSALAVIAVLMILPLLVWLFGYVVRPAFILRTILIGVPGFILFLTLLVELDGSKIRRRLTALILILLFLAEVIAGGREARSEPWREIARILTERAQPGEPIIVCPIFRYPAMHYALAAPIDAPVLGPHGPDIFLIERSFGSDTDWKHAYYENISEPILRFVMTGERSPALDEHILGGQGLTTAWIVLNKCPPEERKAIESWLGSGRMTLIWHGQDNVRHVGTDILRFEADAPQKRTVIGHAAERPR